MLRKLIEKPTLFSGGMVRAILDGRKMKTRRVVQFPRYWKAQGIEHKDLVNSGFWIAYSHKEQRHVWQYGDDQLPQQYHVGDRLWVREKHSWVTLAGDSDSWMARAKAEERLKQMPDGRPVLMCFAADGHQIASNWRPSIFMPRWASRITLEILSVRVERVQEIKQLDAVAEGMSADRHAVIEYKNLWNSINVKRGFGWDVNPWVWVIEFKKLEVCHA